jgi:phosphoribosylformylglycinamidine cyclo-ligase
MVAIVGADSADLAIKALAARGMRAWAAGEVTEIQGKTSAYLVGDYK